MQDDRMRALARELQALAQTGLTYATDPYDRERYERLREIAVDVAAANGPGDPAAVRAAFEIQAGYATPKVDVRAACFRGDTILLVREASDGLWTLPGGWADVTQSASECVIREAWEESGFEVRVTKLAAVLDRDKHRHEPRLLFRIYKMFFVCEIVGGEARPSLETTEVEFFALDRLPPLSIGRVLPDQINAMHRHWKDPSLPTDYD
jgi:ADP-ribose pyrophosphatase YjhB (NUDIX family)